ncbi:unnamed protein product [Aphanomyces euteiches]
MIALMTLVTQGIIGSIYSFSILEPHVKELFGSETKFIQVQLTSTLSLGLAAAVSGPFLERGGPRAGMTVGSILFSVGLLLAQLAIVVKSLPLLYIGFGVLAGIGHGILLISSISTLLKWFPDWRGLVTGVCLAGSGLGTSLWKILYDNMLQSSPSRSLNYLFAVTGGAALVILLLSAMVLRTPPPTFSVNGHDMHNIPLSAAPSMTRVQDDFLNVSMALINFAALEPTHSNVTTDKEYFQQVKALTLVQCIFSTDFFWLFIVFTASLTPTVLFLRQINDAATIILHKTPQDGDNFLSRMTLTTTIGVIIAPLLSDLVIRIAYANPANARKMVFFIMVAVEATMLGLLMDEWKDLSSGVWYGVCACAGGGYGIIPSLITDMFGVYNAGTMYGLIMTSHSIGAVVVGFLLPSMSVTEDAVHVQLVVMFAIVAFAAVMMVFVRTNPTDRFVHGYQLTLCNKVVIRIPSRTNSDATNIEEIRKVAVSSAAIDAFFLISPCFDLKLSSNSQEHSQG